MYLYKIGCYDWDEHENVELQHHLKFSKKEIEEMIIEIGLKFLLNERKKCHHIAWDEGEIIDRDSILRMLKENPNRLKDRDCKDEDTYVEEYGLKYYTRFNNLFSIIIDDMIEKRGFTTLFYQEKIDIEGWEGVVDKERETTVDSKVLDKIREEYWKIKKG